MKYRFTFKTKWEDKELICACFIKNPLCDNYKDCEELDLILNVYGDIEECMRHSKYKKERGIIKQTGK